MRVAYCLVARDDLICKADWLWGQVDGASSEQAFRSMRLKEEKSLFPSGCLLSFVAHAHGGKNRPIRSSDVPMLMRANPEVSPEVQVEWNLKNPGEVLDDRRCPKMLVSDWPASTEGGATAWANQLPEMDLSQEPPPPDWFYWDV